MSLHRFFSATNVVALVFIGVVALALFRQIHSEPINVGMGDDTQTAAVVESPAALSFLRTTPLTGTTSVAAATSTSTGAIVPKKAVATKKAMVVKMSKDLPKASTSSPVVAAKATEIARVQNPYPTAPDSFDNVNLRTRAALVNILCMPSSGSLRPISGSGVIIDPRGVILTNAHVAQYVLLSESPQIDLACTIRTGSPAVAKWTAEVLYISPVWVNTHAADINSSHPTGTGEHDYALLRITGAINGSSLPESFPFLSYETREAIGFLGDPVLGAAYPAEFVGGLNAQNNLNAVSSVSNIAQLLTFGTDTVDAFSIGGVIEAQGGSSGGPVVNAWDKLLGLITTTSDGATTAERSLRAITMSYINRDIQMQTGSNLASLLRGDLAVVEDDFNAMWLQHLIGLYIRQISK